MYNPDFQISILKLLCINTNFAVIYGPLLKPEYFDSEVMKTLFKIILEYVYTYEKELDQSSLLIQIEEYSLSRGLTTEVFKILKDEVRQVFKTHIPSEQFIIDRLVGYCRRQELKTAIIKSIDILEKDGSYEEVLKLVDTAVSTGSGVDQGYTFQEILSLPAIYRNKYSQANLCRTGFHFYDQALMGGLAPGEVHVIQAPPKSGKSTLCVNVGTWCLYYGKVVFHATLEIDKDEVITKYGLRCHLGLKYNDLKYVSEESYREKVASFGRKHGTDLFVQYWTEGTATAMTIRSWISQVRSTTGKSPDIILIDYDDCLRPIRGLKDDLYSDSGEIYADLKQLADYFKCPVLTFAQPKREAWDKPDKGELLDKMDLAHSARKAHRAHSISSLNFAKDKENGILYISDTRRGESNVKIQIKRNLSEAFIGNG